MLSRLGGRGYQVREDQTIYGDKRGDFDGCTKEPQPSERCRRRVSAERRPRRMACTTRS
jgi:hypothetical protein